MDVQELIKEIVREEVRAMLYGDRIKGIDRERVITITKSEQPIDNEDPGFMSNESIDALINKAKTDGGFKSRKNLFASMYNNKEKQAWSDLSSIKRNPQGRRDARIRLVSELQKSLSRSVM